MSHTSTPRLPILTPAAPPPLWTPPRPISRRTSKRVDAFRTWRRLRSHLTKALPQRSPIISSLQRRPPVDQQCDGRSGGIGTRLVEEETLAVRRDDILIAPRNQQTAGLETGQEKRSRRSRAKTMLGI